MINDYLKRLFLESKDGVEYTSLFDPQSIIDKIDKIFDEVKSNISGAITSEMFRKNIQQTIELIKERNLIDISVVDLKDFLKCIAPPQASPRSYPTFISYLSVALYYKYDKLPFYPMLFDRNFELFEKGCQLLGITLGEIPSQSDIDGRINYYGDICKQIEKCREKLNISKSKMCALIYGYSINVLNSSTQRSSYLPDPTRIWLVGASKKNYKDLLVNDEITETIWQGNRNTLPGDIVIVYALAPNSCIHSIWRATRSCSVNPFDFYCNRIRVGHKINVPQLTYKEMKDDPNLKNFQGFKIINSQMQNINGQEVSLEGYNYLLRMLESKDSKCKDRLPRVSIPDFEHDNDPRVEEEVSNGILIPCLTSLGYTEKEWTKELQLKLGRDRYTNESGYRARPDFTFFCEEKGLGQYKSPFIIEVKYEMKNRDEIMSALAQAASYAKMLQANVLAICDKKRIMIYESHNSYFSEKDLKYNKTWNEIRDSNNPEHFLQLKQIISKEVIVQKKRSLHLTTFE